MQLIPHRIPLDPNLPARIRAMLAGTTVAFDLPRMVRLRMRHPEKIKVSEWAARYRVVSDGAHTGPWRHEYAPHTVKIMDTFSAPSTREVWFCGVEQSGKTNTMINCLGWAIDCDPGYIFYLMPTEDTAAKVVGGKIKPTLQNSPRLARYLSGKSDDITLSRITLTHGVTILPAWANSPSSMATWTAKHCFGDEIDKYPPMAGKETDPITLIKKRNRNYKGRFKRFFASTPAGLFIHSGMMNCHQVWEYRLKCPHCDQLIKMDADHLIMPEGATPENIDQLGVTYACNDCGSEWNDQTRDQAIKTGRWHCIQGADIPRPPKVGFHHTAWGCLDIPLAEIAAAYLKAKNGGIAEKTAWANGYEAIDYKPETTGTVTTANLLRYRSELPRNLVPADTAAIILIADTQQSSFYYEAWALGYAPEISMHCFRHGIVEQFADLEGLLAQNHTDASGKQYRFAAGLIDSGGTRRGWQKHSRTVEVYAWCSQNRIMMPVKGMHGRAGELISYKQITSYPGTNKAIPGGLKRANLRVDQFKDELERRLAIEPDDTGALSFHCDIDETFAKHYTTEVKDEAGDWIHNRSAGRNDYFDCNVYALALREMMKLRIPKKPAPPKDDTPTTQTGNFASKW